MAAMNSAAVNGVVLIDISLRMLHKKKQSPFIRPFVSTIQTVLRETKLGETFFAQVQYSASAAAKLVCMCPTQLLLKVAQPEALRKILDQAYAKNPERGVAGVEEETVQAILRPGLDPRAVHVFLDFISYRFRSFHCLSSSSYHHHLHWGRQWRSLA